MKGENFLPQNLSRKIWLIACMSVIAISSGCQQRKNALTEVESPLLGVWEAGEEIHLIAPKKCILITSEHYVDLAEK